MTIIPNGTDAKEIALYFVESTSGRATPDIMKKTIIQAKSLLASGYSKQEIKDVIDYLVEVKHANMFSLGYVSVSINTTLQEMQEAKQKEIAINEKQSVREDLEQAYRNSEVKQVDGESAQRNRDKAGRLGVQSRFGKELDFNMFKE